MHQQKATNSNAEDRESLVAERVERSNMLSFNAYMAEHTNGKGQGVLSTSTSRTRCPFQVTLRRNESDGSVTFTVDNTTHNHAPSEDLAAYAAARTLSYEQLLTIKQLCKAGVQKMYYSLPCARPTHPTKLSFSIPIISKQNPRTNIMLVAYHWILFGTC